jgi:hypothetical protein
MSHPGRLAWAREPVPVTTEATNLSSTARAELGREVHATVRFTPADTGMVKWGEYPRLVRVGVGEETAEVRNFAADPSRDKKIV